MPGKRKPGKLTVPVFILVLTATLLFTGGAVTGYENTGHELYFTILHTNDEHASLIPHGPAIDFHPERENQTVGGFARLAAAVRDMRDAKAALDEPVVLINAGDFTGGTVFSWLTLQGEATELKLMQQMGYDVAAIGNHEFDYSPDVLARCLAEAGYPEAHAKTALLGTNLLIPEKHPLASAELKDIHVLELENGLRLGFFSLVGKEATSVIVDRGPVEIIDQEKTARGAVSRLQELGVNLVIAVTHCGEDEDRELAEKVAGIDIIIGGHSHTALEEPLLVNGTLIVQTGAFLRHLGVLELSYNRSTGEVRARNGESGSPYLLLLDHSIPLDPDIERAVEDSIDAANGLVKELTGGLVEHILEPVAASDFILWNKPPNEENRMGNFVTDAMRFIVEEKTGRKVDFAFQGSGIIRHPVIPGMAAHSRGFISFYDITEAVGLGRGRDGSPGYPLAGAYFTGEEVLRMLEISAIASQYMGDDYFLQVSGLRYEYDPERVVLFRIPGLELPFPSTRAVIKAERYTGSGPQTGADEDYSPLRRGDDNLYYIVSDYALLEAALPQANALLPWMAIEPKDSEGNTVDDIASLIIYDGDKELKVWQAAVEYLSRQPAGPSGYPTVNPYYSETGSRIGTVETMRPGTAAALFLMVLWDMTRPYILLLPVLFLAVVAWIILRRKKKAASNKG
ncbi:MAG: metallophosphoesterase [Dethiobacteria bacterium]